ncbi:chorismate mutase [Candidatus Riflebacteria bacterium]
MTLDSFREQIDIIDQEIIIFLGKRLDIVRRAAKHKIENNIKIFDPEREKKLLKRLRNIARNEGVCEDFIVKIYKVIIEHSKNIQYYETL